MSQAYNRKPKTAYIIIIKNPFKRFTRPQNKRLISLESLAINQHKPTHISWLAARLLSHFTYHILLYQKLNHKPRIVLKEAANCVAIRARIDVLIYCRRIRCYQKTDDMCIQCGNATHMVRNENILCGEINHFHLYTYFPYIVQYPSQTIGFAKIYTFLVAFGFVFRI